MPDEALKSIPSIHRLLADPQITGVSERLPHGVLVTLVRAVVEGIRESVRAGAEAPNYGEIVDLVVAQAQEWLRPSLRPVINATGVVIHTNLGRAPLSVDAMAAMNAVSSGYSNLEFDLQSGERGSRHTHLETALVRLTGAEAATAVNNNAAALLLVLSALAEGKEVVISRGQLVEIGGGFRIPDVMVQGGARLVEVGATNRTYIRDYGAAITPDTAAFLRVHSSNFRIVGFTAEPSLAEMVDVAHSHGLLVIDDIGSGCLIDVTTYGMAAEPTVQESLAAGADLVLFSGDKLLGGPQAGIIVGKEALIRRVQRHPLARAVRLDKASIAGLEVTLRHHLLGEATEKIPIWRMISTPESEIARRAAALGAAIGSGARVEAGRSMVGGGSLPGESLPTTLISVPAGRMGADRLSFELRHGDPPIVARVARDSILIDLRTVDPVHDGEIMHAMRTLLQK